MGADAEKTANDAVSLHGTCRAGTDRTVLDDRAHECATCSSSTAASCRRRAGADDRQQSANRRSSPARRAAACDRACGDAATGGCVPVERASRQWRIVVQSVLDVIADLLRPARMRLRRAARWPGGTTGPFRQGTGGWRRLDDDRASPRHSATPCSPWRRERWRSPRAARRGIGAASCSGARERSQSRLRRGLEHIHRCYGSAPLSPAAVTAGVPRSVRRRRRICRLSLRRRRRDDAVGRVVPEALERLQRVQPLPSASGNGRRRGRGTAAQRRSAGSPCVGSWPMSVLMRSLTAGRRGSHLVVPVWRAIRGSSRCAATVSATAPRRRRRRLERPCRGADALLSEGFGAVLTAQESPERLLRRSGQPRGEGRAVRVPHLLSRRT
jgi:hypothetical protein